MKKCYKCKIKKDLSEFHKYEAINYLNGDNYGTRATFYH